MRGLGTALLLQNRLWAAQPRPSQRPAQAVRCHGGFFVLVCLFVCQEEEEEEEDDNVGEILSG